MPLAARNHPSPPFHISLAPARRGDNRTVLAKINYCMRATRGPGMTCLCN